MSLKVDICLVIENTLLDGWMVDICLVIENTLLDGWMVDICLFVENTLLGGRMDGWELDGSQSRVKGLLTAIKNRNNEY